VNVHKNAKLTPAGRAGLVKRVLFEGQSVGGVSRSLGVSPTTVRKWVRRYEGGGWKALEDRSSRPRRSPRRLPRGTVRRIEQLRRRRWASLRIAEALELAVSTVGLWLRRLGLGRLRMLEPKPVVMRYEKKRHERGESAGGFLQRAVAWFGAQDVFVERVMTDNGGCYMSQAFRAALEALGVRHIRTRPYRPQTNGKAERFIQTAKREWAYARAYRSSPLRSLALPGFLDRYNRRRPHRGLGNRTPLSRLEELL